MSSTTIIDASEHPLTSVTIFKSRKAEIVRSFKLSFQVCRFHAISPEPTYSSLSFYVMLMIASTHRKARTRSRSVTFQDPLIVNLLASLASAATSSCLTSSARTRPPPRNPSSALAPSLSLKRFVSSKPRKRPSSRRRKLSPRQILCSKITRRRSRATTSLQSRRTTFWTPM